MNSPLVNENPEVYASNRTRTRTAEELAAEDDDDVVDPIDELEIFDLIRNIKDPEHPHTLEELRVVEPELIHLDWAHKTVRVFFTPTVPHCSLTTLIGLSIFLQLQRSLPEFTKIDIFVTPGSHNQEMEVNKQLNDKERVAAALENQNLVKVVESCIYAFDESECILERN